MAKWWNKPIDWKGEDRIPALFFALCFILAIVQSFLGWETNIGFFEGIAYAFLFGVVAATLWYGIVFLFGRFFKGPLSV